MKTNDEKVIMGLQIIFVVLLFFVCINSLAQAKIGTALVLAKDEIQSEFANKSPANRAALLLVNECGNAKLSKTACQLMAHDAATKLEGQSGDYAAQLRSAIDYLYSDAPDREAAARCGTKCSSILDYYKSSF